jgi:hypothetical protein
MPFEEWIYGRPPQPVEFVRINGNRVIRVEVAKVGEPPEIFTKDEVEGLMRTDGTPLEAAVSHTRTVQAGDTERNPDTQAPATPPSLRKPGEQLPTDDDKSSRVGVMKPVQFPKPKPAPQPGANPDGDTGTQPAQPAADASQPAKPANPDGSQTAPAKPQAPDASQSQ